jgi:hypothetical protein
VGEVLELKRADDMASATKRDQELLEERLRRAESEDASEREMEELQMQLKEAELLAETIKRDKEIMEETLATMALAHLQEKQELEEKIEMLQVEMERLLRSRWYVGRKQRPEGMGFRHPADRVRSHPDSDDESRSPRGTFSFAP